MCLNPAWLGHCTWRSGRNAMVQVLRYNIVIAKVPDHIAGHTLRTGEHLTQMANALHVFVQSGLQGCNAIDWKNRRYAFRRAQWLLKYQLKPQSGIPHKQVRHISVFEAQYYRRTAQRAGEKHLF